MDFAFLSVRRDEFLQDVSKFENFEILCLQIFCDLFLVRVFQADERNSIGNFGNGWISRLFKIILDVISKLIGNDFIDELSQHWIGFQVFRGVLLIIFVNPFWLVTWLPHPPSLMIIQEILFSHYILWLAFLHEPFGILNYIRLSKLRDG